MTARTLLIVVSVWKSQSSLSTGLLKKKENVSKSDINFEKMRSANQND